MTERGCTLVAVPDDEGGVLNALRMLDELLWFSCDGEPIEGVVARDGVRVVRRLAGQVAVAAEARPATPVAPDGRFELVGLSWALVAADDVAELARIGRVLRGGGELADAAREFGGQDLVDVAARLADLLSAPADRDVAVLAWALLPGAGRVVLSDTQMAAYTAVTRRILATWHAGDRLAGFLYRGAG